MPTVYSPPVSTYVALATVTLAATDASITFSSIPASYRDLILVMDYSINSGGSSRIEINADSGSNYSTVYLYNANSGFSPSGAISGTETTTYLPTNVSAASKFWSILQFMDYSATDKHKTILTRTNNTDEYVVAAASRWASTSAINSLEIFTSANSFEVGNTFSLFGVEA